MRTKTPKEIEKKLENEDGELKSHQECYFDGYDKGFQKSQEMMREKIEEFRKDLLYGNSVLIGADARWVNNKVEELLSKIGGEE